MNITVPTSVHQAGLVRLETKPTSLVGLVPIPESAITVTVRAIGANPGVILVEGPKGVSLLPEQSVELPFADLDAHTIRADYTRPMGKSR